MKTHYSNEPPHDRAPRKARKTRIPQNEFQPECTIPLVRVEDDIDDESRKYLSVKRSLPVTIGNPDTCLLYTSPSPRDATLARMPSSA